MKVKVNGDGPDVLLGVAGRVLTVGNGAGVGCRGDRVGAGVAAGVLGVEREVGVPTQLGFKLVLGLEWGDLPGVACGAPGVVGAGVLGGGGLTAGLLASGVAAGDSSGTGGKGMSGVGTLAS